MRQHIRMIGEMKRSSLNEARAISIPVFNSLSEKVGHLVPVGPWLLTDVEKISLMTAWRARNNRMFLSQTRCSDDITYGYLETRAIEKECFILFLIFDVSDKFVGHIGMDDIDDYSGDLDNVVRGVAGGDTRLIYYSEIALLDWCFKNTKMSLSTLGVLSYNWMAKSCHEDVGFVSVEHFLLKKREENGATFHEVVAASEANVTYSLERMKLAKDDFYRKNIWINK